MATANENESITVPAPEIIKTQIVARRAEVKELQRLYRVSIAARRTLIARGACAAPSQTVVRNA